MPPRSVLLNVSIQARGIGKESLVEEVKEVNVRGEKSWEQGSHKRVDSAASNVTPSINTSLGIASSTSTSSTLANAPSCATCRQLTKSDGSRLSYCKACTSVFYCSRDCQRLHWPSHKRHCDHRSNPNRDALRTSSAVATSPTAYSAVPSAAASPTDVYHGESIIGTAS